MHQRKALLHDQGRNPRIDLGSFVSHLVGNLSVLVKNVFLFSAVDKRIYHARFQLRLVFSGHPRIIVGHKVRRIRKGFWKRASL